MYFARKESDDENHYDYVVKLRMGKNELEEILNNLRRLRDELKSFKIDH
jgi:hypothetical protein